MGVSSTLCIAGTGAPHTRTVTLAVVTQHARTTHG